MAWKIFENKRGRTKKDPYIYITKPGRIYFSSALYKKSFANSTYLTLAYDPQHRRIGLRPEGRPTENTYSIATVGRSAHVTIAPAFFKHHNISLDKPIRKTTYQEGRFVVVELD